MTRDLFQRFLAILSGKSIALVLTVISTPVIVRLLGEESYGTYAFLIATFGILSTLSNFGMSQSLRKFFAESREVREWKEIVVTFYLYLTLSISLVLLSLGWLAVESGIISRYFDSTLSQYIYFVLIFVVLSQIFSLCRSVLMASGNEHQSEPLVVFKEIIFVIVGIVVLYQGFSVGGLMMSHIIATFSVALIGIYLSSNFLNLNQMVSISIPQKQIFEFLSFSASSAVAIFLLTSLYHVDIILVQYFLGSTKTGYYKAALVSAEFLWFVPNAIQVLFIHSTSELWSNNAYKEITRITSRATKYTLLLTSLLAIGLAGLSDPFVSLYFGADFEPAIDPLLILIPGAVGFAIVRPIYATNYSNGNIRPVIIATGSAAIVNLVLNLLLIPRFGMVGAAAATSVGYGSMLVFHLRYGLSLGYNPISKVEVIPTLTAILITTVAVFGAARIIETGIIELLVIPPIGGLVFALLLHLTGYLQISEMRQILGRLN